MMWLLILVLILVPSFALALDAGFDLPPEYAKRVSDGIERYRKSDAVVKVIDRDGNPAVGADVEINQISHDFLFGCAFPSWDISEKQPNPQTWEKFEHYFLTLFNYTTTENMLKWKPLEKTEGQPNYKPVDAFVDWCHEHKIKIKGHCLIWGLEPQGYPDWLVGRSPEEIPNLAHKHINEVVTRYKGKIDIWDVVNEPLHCHWFEKNMGEDYAEKALKWAREANPTATLLVNEWGCHTGAADEFAKYCRNMRFNRAPLDAVGEQAHDGAFIPGPKNIYDTFDKLSSTGCDIHITEKTFQSNGQDIKSDFVQGKWTPEIQGKYYRYYYTLAFSYPKVKAITLWAMWDGSSWLDQGGIISKDWTPKPAYEVLNSLINKEWRTHQYETVGSDGASYFRGFNGEYEVKITHNGITTTTKMHIAEGKKNIVTLRVP